MLIDSIGLEKTRFPTYKQKQYMIIGGIVLVIIILVIAIIVLAVDRGDDSNSKETDKPSDTTHPSDTPQPPDTDTTTPPDTDTTTPPDTDTTTPTDTDQPTPTDTDQPTPTDTDQPTPTDTDAPTDAPTDADDDDDHNPEDRIGEINAIYRKSGTISILSDEFIKQSSFSIYINDKFVKYTKTYTFEGASEYEVKYYIYEDINMKNMFKNVVYLTKVDLNSNKNMKITSLESAFNGCSDLNDLSMQGCDTSSLTSIKYFLSGTNIKNNNIQISFENVKDISYMFAGVKFATIDLSNLNTENVENMRGLFKNSETLNNLDLSRFNTKNVLDMSGMFEGCYSLVSITFSDKFVTNKVTNMSSMFADCGRIKKIDVQNFNTENVNDMSSMFKECNSLSSLDLRKFETKNVKNMKSMFDNCKKLKKLDMPTNLDFSNVVDTSYMFRENRILNTLNYIYCLYY